MRPLPLVLAPGHLCDERLFGPQIEALEDVAAFTPAEVTLDDTMAGMADRLLQDAPERFAVLGLSMGGILAMEVVARAPGRVLGAALLNTNPFAETTDARERRLAQAADVRGRGLTALVEGTFLPAYLAPDNPRGEAIRALVRAMAADAGEAVYFRQADAIGSRRDAREALGAFDGPVLAVGGDHDTLCPIDRHEAIAAAAPNAELHVLRGCGHLSTLERPEALNPLLRAWLGRCCIRMQRGLGS